MQKRRDSSTDLNLIQLRLSHYSYTQQEIGCAHTATKILAFQERSTQTALCGDATLVDYKLAMCI